MKRNLFVFIGGSDGQNGDYSAVHSLARRGGTSRWSSLKTARPGDRVLIYIQRPHSALVAKAEVLTVPAKGDLGDWPYVTKLGKFELLPNRITLGDLDRIRDNKLSVKINGKPFTITWHPKHAKFMRAATVHRS